MTEKKPSSKPGTTGKVERARRRLAGQGLNLLAIFDWTVLPADLRSALAGAGVPLAGWRRLVLIGHGGRRFWEAAGERGLAGPDPLDRFSLELARRFLVEAGGDSDPLVLYPLTDFPVPLQRLGELAHWAHPSPLGSGISPAYGLWFAYRAALLTAADLPLLGEEPRLSPCATCADRPCVSACPAGAVGDPRRFDLAACAGHRLAPASSCAATCLARLACPVAPEHRYPPEQIHYHYRLSLPAIRAYTSDRPKE